ncbi:antitoxin [Leptospira sp. 'Mane']|uniref:antitoxin n=1 Tax=Leptospira sp. 'Mane' TaxID=3387407 RepID=UPI00398A7206
MKSITFRADERAIEKARLKASKQKRSLNDIFNDWLRAYSEVEPKDFDLDSYLKNFEYVKINRKVSREEANER